MSYKAVITVKTRYGNKMVMVKGTHNMTDLEDLKRVIATAYLKRTTYLTERNIVNVMVCN